MKAVSATRPGGVEVLVYGEHPDPVAGFDEVVVEVKAAAVNRADTVLRADPGGRFPLILGHDCAGVVVALGPGAPADLLGHKVILNPVISCGRCEHCQAGRQGDCPARRALGRQLDGTYAEFVKAPSANALVLTAPLAFEEAAAMPSAFFTAWQMLVSRAAVQPGETVVVVGAGGGLGAAAVQVARVLGAVVIATASTPEKLARARSLGADALVNHASEPLADRVRELTGGRGCDVIIDTVGPSLWDEHVGAIGRGGRIVLASSTTGDQIVISVRKMVHERLSILGSGPQGSHANAAAVTRLINQGRFRGVVDRVFPLKDAALAHAALEGRSVIGKLILKP
jgi:NADPH:quinone reductase-like Zn-dependent oxidoreductase